MSLRTIALGVAFAVSIGCAATAATLTNGSLTGPIATASVPPGWVTLLGSPDTMDENNNVGTTVPFNVAPSGPSPDGGTWVGFANSTGAFEEQFGQTITDFVIGQSYTLSWYGGNFGALTSTSYDGTNSIFASLDGTVVGTASALAAGPDWTLQSIMFTATATTHLLGFGLADNVNSYLSIDGISISRTQVIPVPAGGVLLLSGLLCLGALRRKRLG